jgi:hypothetical protein
MTMDIKDFYLNNDLKRPEFMMIPVRLIPKAIFDQYNLGPLVHLNSNSCNSISLQVEIPSLYNSGVEGTTTI